jgi:signal transduction histidine kinase
MLDVIIHTLVLPHYPTAEEQAAANNQQNQALLSQTIAYFDSQQTWIKVGLIAAIIVIVVVVVVLVLVLRHQRHTDNEINNQNSRGWGRGRM